MIQGEITARREAIFDIIVIGTGGSIVSVRAALDTGFDDYLTLPRDLINELKLPYIGSIPIRLGDGQIVNADVFRVSVVWHNKRRVISVQATDKDILIGMSLVYGSVVVLEVVDGGLASIEQIEPEE